MFDLMIKTTISVLPSLTFVLILLHLDTHRLISHHLLGRVFLGGALLALVAWFLNGFLLDMLSLSFRSYTVAVAPVVEECLKAGLLIWLFRRDRVGFQIDAAILGFTIGTSFSLIENLFFLFSVSEAHYGTWLVRGFGTAIMHGGCTALFGVITQIMTERHLKMSFGWYLPGLVIAILFHAGFNQFPVSPLFSTVITLAIIPSLLFLLFERNEVSIHNFLEQDFETHRRLLEQLKGGEPSNCETGRFLVDVESTFSSPTNEHMRLYIHIHTELILSAESLLMAREDGIDIVVEDETHNKIKELHLLEKHIGKAGMHTLSPHLQLSRQEFWLLHMFEEEVAEMARNA